MDNDFRFLDGDESPDVIQFPNQSESVFEMYMGEGTGNIDLITESKGTPWKYNEEELLKELLEYIRGTYSQHYSAGDDKIQTLDLIEALW